MFIFAYKLSNDPFYSKALPKVNLILVFFIFAWIGWGIYLLNFYGNCLTENKYPTRTGSFVIIILALCISTALALRYIITICIMKRLKNKS